MYHINIIKQQYGELTVLSDLKTSINEGEFVAIMGESGSGKTTFLNILSGIVDEYEGEISYFDAPLQTLNKKQLTEFRGKEIGMIFQDFQLIDFLNVTENILLGNDHSSVEQVNEMLEKLGILDIKDKSVLKCSGGQLQRVAIARALISGKKVVLADEPTASLDSKSGREIMEILKMLHEEGLSIIMITHSPSIASYASRLLYLYDGHFVSDLQLGDKDQSSRLKDIMDVVGEVYEANL
ncbi:MAG: ABC transporter ATP-binding protein [Erysipelothrix sp.]|nr:ABC transporter ATP-binding protein [Erysipelothrix sp.]